MNVGAIPTVTPQLLSARAEMARLRGEPSSAQWRAAVSAWEKVGAPYEIAYANWHFADSLLKCGGRQFIGLPARGQSVPDHCAANRRRNGRKTTVRQDRPPVAGGAHLVGCAWGRDGAGRYRCPGRPSRSHAPGTRGAGGVRRAASATVGAGAVAPRLRQVTQRPPWAAASALDDAELVTFRILQDHEPCLR